MSLEGGGLGFAGGLRKRDPDSLHQIQYNSSTFLRLPSDAQSSANTKITVAIDLSSKELWECHLKVVGWGLGEV